MAASKRALYAASSSAAGSAASAPNAPASAMQAVAARRVDRLAPASCARPIAITASPVASHVRDDLVAELAALDLARALHQAGEVVGDVLARDGPVHALDDQVGGLGPAHVAQHHLARQDDRAGVDLVLVGVLGGGAVGRLEDGVAAAVVDVASRCDADAADLRGERVGGIVAVEVERRDDVELVGARQYLLEEDVGDGVLDHDLPG